MDIRPLYIRAVRALSDFLMHCCISKQECVKRDWGTLHFSSALKIGEGWEVFQKVRTLNGSGYCLSNILLTASQCCRKCCAMFQITRLTCSDSTWAATTNFTFHKFVLIHPPTIRHSVTVLSVLSFPRVGPGHPFSLCPFTASSFPFLLFSFFHWIYLFSSFVHPFPFYQHSPTPFPGRRS